MREKLLEIKIDYKGKIKTLLFYGNLELITSNIKSKKLYLEIKGIEIEEFVNGKRNTILINKENKNGTKYTNKNFFEKIVLKIIREEDSVCETIFIHEYLEIFINKYKELAIVLGTRNIYKKLPSKIDKKGFIYELEFATNDYLFYENEKLGKCMVVSAVTGEIITKNRDKQLELYEETIINKEYIIYTKDEDLI